MSKKNYHRTISAVNNCLNTAELAGKSGKGLNVLVHLMILKTEGREIPTAVTHALASYLVGDSELAEVVTAVRQAFPEEALA